MSNGGGGESSKGSEPCLKKRRKNDEFAESIARFAVAQVCESAGFQGFQQSALDTISDIACKYIRDIGKTSSFYANLAGRTECNVLDIVQGLEDLGLSQGFVGASDRDHCFSKSGIIKEISQYVGVSEEIGFAYSVPSFPVIKERKLTSSFLQAGETPPTGDIPPWLPRFPDPKTYAKLPSASREETEMRPDKPEQEQKVLEPSALKLKQRLACNDSEFSVVVEQGDDVGRERAYNPFLAVPLQPGEKEISLVSLPAKFMEEDMVQHCKLRANNLSTFDTLAPPAQEIRSNEHDYEEASKKVLLNSRHTVQLKFRIGNKSLDTANRHNNKGNVEPMSWFVNEEARDGKERRTEPMELDVGEHTESESIVK